MLQNKTILSNGPIGDWTPYEDSMSGTLEWYRKENESTIIYATPHWETDGVVPFAIAYTDGDYVEVTQLELDTKESVEYQLNQYLSVLTTILSKIK